MRLDFAIMATAIACSATLLTASWPASAGYPGFDGRIAFTTDRDGDNEIYSMNPDGSDETNLTQNAASDFDAAWSPDGTMIAFASDRDGFNDWDVFVMDADGGHPVNLTNDPALDWNPTWSPDGTQIAFTSYRAGGGEIFVMDADGANVVQLTSNTFYDRHPKWSPDGARIAFETYRDDNWEIFVMDADGTSEIRITDNLEYDFEPDWSPDGAFIAWRTGLFDGVGDIAVISSDGLGAITNLTNDPAYDREPAWSPDGSRIAFATVDGANFDVVVMDADGTNPITLTGNAGNDYDPDWQPSQAQWTVDVTKAGAGSGIVRSRPAGIRCGSDCTQDYPEGITVGLRATASAGSTFAGWSGACSGVGDCFLTIDGPVELTATFSKP